MIQLGFIWKACLLIGLWSFSVGANYYHHGRKYRRDNYNGGDLYGSDWVRGELCARECRVGAPRLKCYWKIVVEHYTSINAACDYNKPWSGEMTYAKAVNSSSPDGCVLLDGVERSFLVTNRKYPVSYQGCKGDFFIIDVENKAPVEAISVHWHGIEQFMTQYSDGVPGVTQCTIRPDETFRYFFEVNREGTYYSHNHKDVALSLAGPLIVRQPKNVDPNGNMYDYDRPEHYFMMTDILAQYKVREPPSSTRNFLGEIPDNIFINGHGKFRDRISGNWTATPYATFVMDHGKRYRIRIINAMASVCLAKVSITNHVMTVIATDGIAVKPTKIDAYISGSGERLDVVVTANCKSAAQWIIARGLDECAAEGIYQLAILRCRNGPAIPSFKIDTYQKAVQNQPDRVLLNPSTSGCIVRTPGVLCITDLERLSLDPNDNELDSSLAYRVPDQRIVLPLSFIAFDNRTFYKQNVTSYYVSPFGDIVQSQLNMQTGGEPTPPILLSVVEERGYELQKEAPFIIWMRRNSIVEVTVVDADCTRGLNHPFHKHGGHYDVLMSVGDDDFDNTLKNASWQQRVQASHRLLDSMRQSGSLNPTPARKDTSIVPYCGLVVYTFNTSNPGPWLFHCHFAWHHATGMSIVFQVGGPQDLPPVPPYFPRCWSFQPSAQTINQYFVEGVRQRDW